MNLNLKWKKNEIKNKNIALYLMWKRTCKSGSALSVISDGIYSNFSFPLWLFFWSFSSFPIISTLFLLFFLFFESSLKNIRTAVTEVHRECEQARIATDADCVCGGRERVEAPRGPSSPTKAAPTLAYTHPNEKLRSQTHQQPLCNTCIFSNHLKNLASR